MKLSEMSALIPYHSHIDPEISIESVDHLIDDVDQGKQVFYEFYTEEEKEADPSKYDTGLFFYRGDIDTSFVVQCADGAPSYFGSLHESMPFCVEINKHGHNAFAIKYKTGTENAAAEDLAAAVLSIIENADEMGVSTESYSVWGGSAGARMVAEIGSYGTACWVGNAGKTCKVKYRMIMQSAFCDRPNYNGEDQNEIQRSGRKWYNSFCYGAGLHGYDACIWRAVR